MERQRALGREHALESDGEVGAVGCEREREEQRMGRGVVPVQNVAPVNVAPSLAQAAFALAGDPEYPVSHVSSDAPASTLSAQPASVLSQSVPSLRVPTGSLHLSTVGFERRRGVVRW